MVLLHVLWYGGAFEAIGQRSSLQSLLPVFGVNDDGYRAIVGEGDLHISSKFTTGTRFVVVLGAGIQEGFVERDGGFRSGGLNKRGSIAFFGAGVQGELTYHEEFTIDVQQAAVHFTMLVWKNTHFADFANQPIDVFLTVAFDDSEQDEQPLPNGSGGRMIDADTCLGNSLNDDAHEWGGLVDQWLGWEGVTKSRFSLRWKW